MRLVMIEWGDPSSTSDPIWQDREDIDSLDAVSCVTVGILLKETNDDVRVVLSSNLGHYSQAITILKSCIKRLRYLKVK